MWSKLRAIFGLILIMAGTLLVFQDKIPAKSCGKWFAFGNSVSQVHHLIKAGRELIAQKKWDGAAKKFEEASKHCEENAGYFLIARANLLAFYTNEKQGRAKQAIHFAERAERLLVAIPKNDRNYANAQRLLKGIKGRLARLRPLNPGVKSNLITPPPIKEPMIPQAYRRVDQKPEQPPKKSDEPKELAVKSPETEPVEPKPLDPEPPAIRPIAPTPEMAVRITSIPVGAGVRVNGEEKGVTPLVLKDLDTGKHQIDVYKESHNSQSRLIRLAPGAQLALNFKLIRNKRNSLFEKRTRLLALTKKRGGNRSSSVILATKPRKRANLRRNRNGKLGRLIVESRPASMVVYIDGNARGKTPLTVRSLHPGIHKVEVGVPERTDKVQLFKLKIQPGKISRLNVVMNASTVKEVAQQPDGTPRLDEGVGEAVKNGEGAPSKARVTYVQEDSSREGRSVTEVTPESELPIFMRADHPVSMVVTPESQTSGQQSNVPKNGSAQQKDPAVNGFTSIRSLLTHKSPELGLIGIGLVLLVSSLVGWRKRQNFLSPSEDAENTTSKVMIYDLDKENEESTEEAEIGPSEKQDDKGPVMTAETGTPENQELPDPEGETENLTEMADATSPETPTGSGAESDEETSQPAPESIGGENLDDPGEFGDDESWAESVLGEMGDALADEIESDEDEPLTLSKLQAEKLEERIREVEKEETLDEESESETEDIISEENPLTLSKMQAIKKEELSAPGEGKKDEEVTA